LFGSCSSGKINFLTIFCYWTIIEIYWTSVLWWSCYKTFGQTRPCVSRWPSLHMLLRGWQNMWDHEIIIGWCYLFFSFLCTPSVPKCKAPKD
jgi:hypothetical protein